MTEFFVEHLITLSISTGVTCLFAAQQWFYFTKNRRLISALRDYFLADSSQYKTAKQDEVCLISETGGSDHPGLDSLIDEINHYVQKSIGTADFNIIQNKTERKIESLYEHATAELSFPTYYGLMGTFLGTFIGLVGFLISGSDLSDENKVTNLIIGVLVSMATSLFGLALTTHSNHLSALSKKQLDEQKNEFLDFIQLDLIPQLQTTITTLQQTMEGFVPKFDTVINNFERTFTGVIGRFKETFDLCTDNFGTEFRENTSLISETVATLNDSIGHITDNVENQRKLLEELRSEQMFSTLQEFVEASETFHQSTSAIDTYNELLQSLMFTTQSVIDKQTEYAQSLHIPQELVVQLNELLNRISLFERNINALGDNIAQSEMLGNKELALIQRHLESLEEKKQLADRFLDTSNDELEAIFQQQGKLVKALFSNYQQQLEDERNALSEFVRETLQIISKKKTDLLNHLEHAFDVSRVNAMFSHLKTLPEIMAKLEEVEQVIIRDSDLGQHIQNLLSYLNELKNVVSSASALEIQTIGNERALLANALQDESEQNRHTIAAAFQVVHKQQQESLESLLFNTNQLQESLASIIQTTDHQQQELMRDEMTSLEEKINETQGEIKALKKEVKASSSELSSEVMKVTSSTRYLQRDIVKEIGANISGEAHRIQTSISDQGHRTEALIRTTSEETLDRIRQLSSKGEHES